MARENQGFQIALIVFVMLTIVLSVMTFLFYRKYDDADRLAQDYAKKKAETDTNLSKKEAECGDLKQMLGYPREDDFASIMERSIKEREPYKKIEKDDPDKLPSFHKIFEYLTKSSDEKSKALADVQESLRKLKLDFGSRETASKSQFDVVAKQRDDLKQQLAVERAQAAKDREQYKKDLLDEADKREKSLKDLGNDLTSTVAKLKDADKSLKKVDEENRELRVAVNNATRTTAIAQFTGQVKWVDQKNSTVWIDLGRADGLNRQTSFSVYASDAIDLTKSGKKASIEVIQVQGEHSAEARIVEDKMSDPIMPGDKIYSPVWSRGQRKHFALIGFMDIDGDGKGDTESVRNLITLNGGVVDYELADNGDQGAMTVTTRYLVKGEPPNSTSSMDRKFEDFAKAYGKALKDAEKYGIESIPLTELLTRMGWKQPLVVTRAGGGQIPSASFETPQTKPPEAAPKPSDNGDEITDGSLSASIADDVLSDSGDKPKSPAKSSSKSTTKADAKSSSAKSDSKTSTKSESKTSDKTDSKSSDKSDSKTKAGKTTGKAKDEAKTKAEAGT